jgi:hypothetical protein
LQIELIDSADRDRRQSLLETVQHLDVVADDDVGVAAAQQLHPVDLRSAHLDVDVEPGFLVEPGGFGLIEAAVLRLGEPVREEANFRRRTGRADAGTGSNEGTRGAGDRRAA